MSNKLDVPQADDFDKIAALPLAVFKEIKTSKKLAKYFGFTTRQSSYYREAAEMLNLVVLNPKSKKYELTKIGKKYVTLPKIAKKVFLINLIFTLPIIQEILFELERIGSTKINLEIISNVIKKQTKYGEFTARRRAQTTLSWFGWARRVIDEIKAQTVID